MWSEGYEGDLEKVGLFASIVATIILITMKINNAGIESFTSDDIWRIVFIGIAVFSVFKYLEAIIISVIFVAIFAVVATIYMAFPYIMGDITIMVFVILRVRENLALIKEEKDEIEAQKEWFRKMRASGIPESQWYLY